MTLALLILCAWLYASGVVLAKALINDAPILSLILWPLIVPGSVLALLLSAIKNRKQDVRPVDGS